MSKHQSVYVAFVALLIAASVMVIGCGAGGSGKGLARDMVKAIEQEDQARIEEITREFDELGPVQKVRFATEMAKQGDRVQDYVKKTLGEKMSQ